MRLLLAFLLLCLLQEFALGRNIVKRQCGNSCNSNNCCSANTCSSNNCNNCPSRNCNNCPTSNCNNCQSNNCDQNEPIQPTDPILVPFPPPAPVYTSSGSNNTNVNAYNFTADITLTNIINTVNNISIPVTVNNTNINHVTILQESNTTSTSESDKECSPPCIGQVLPPATQPPPIWVPPPYFPPPPCPPVWTIDPLQPPCQVPPLQPPGPGLRCRVVNETWIQCNDGRSYNIRINGTRPAPPITPIQPPIYYPPFYIFQQPPTTFYPPQFPTPFYPPQPPTTFFPPQPPYISPPQIPIYPPQTQPIVYPPPPTGGWGCQSTYPNSCRGAGWPSSSCQGCSTGSCPLPCQGRQNY